MARSSETSDSSDRYVPLWCKTHYSFLEGASSPEELVERACALGLPALAVTDRDGVYGLPSAWVAAKEQPLQLISGSQITVTDLNGNTDVADANHESQLMLLAADRTGYANLCRLITAGRLRCPKGECRVTWSEVAAHAPGMIALWGGRDSLLVREQGTGCDRTATLMTEAFGDRLYTLAARHLSDQEQRQEQRLRDHATCHEIPVVAGLEVLYHLRSRRPLQDVLTCIRQGVPLGDAGRLLHPNDRHALVSPAIFARLFADDPAAVARTREVADRCTFTLDQLRYRYPSEHLPRGMTSARWLEHLVYAGSRERFGDPVPRDLRDRLRRELDLIHDLDYDGYFLTMWEIVQFCRDEGILCQGRGSAANSVVCYCLGVTAVNPREVDLLFERFISRERAEPPDIDLDIEHGRREEVIQYVYRKYGRQRAAMVANVVRFRPRSAVREVGKALGLPAVNLDRLAKMTSYRGGLSEEELTAAGFDPAAPLHGHLLQLADEIQDFPRHLSIHPGGFLLGHEPVPEMVPVENATMADRTVIQWNKYDVEALGLFKVDLLGLGALNQLHIAFDLLKRHRDLDFTLASLPRGDGETFDMLCRADSVGTFQVESRAQMNMLPRLRPRTYYDLVVQVAIVRPGPITGGMVHPYIARRHGAEAVTYPHPMLEPVLRKTLGVPLFQEQVMRLAMLVADYTPGEADQLRRDMATWRRNGPIESHHERLVSRMVAKGIAPEFAERVFAQIRGFGEYGFPESHAASFALIAYATSWLKCHHHAEFTCSLLNAQPMGFYSSGTIVEDARRHDVVVRPIDVLHSVHDCTLEEIEVRAAGGLFDLSDAGAAPVPASWAGRPLAVRMGLRYVKGLGAEDIAAIIVARMARPFNGIADLARRADLPSDALVALAEAGALAAFEEERRKALWAVHGLSRRDRPEQLLLPLDDCEPPPPLAGLSELEEINWDWKGTGHSTKGHLLEPLREELSRQGWPTASQVSDLPGGRRVDYAGIVICRQRPGTAKDVTFMTLEDETGFVNLVLWGSVFEQFKVLAKTLSLMGVTGKVQSEEGVVHVIVDRIWEPQLTSLPERGRSRDFH